uniref:Atxe2 family lasso peptide isopeptidase n=1 Tax=uncultured Sphingomonas sp. TaxID=158754 RepID=UPI0035CA2194
RADGTHSDVVTHSRTDVDALAWRRDGDALVYSTAAGRSEADLAIEREGRGGWNYDARILPYLSARPRVSGSIPTQRYVIDVATGRIQAATPDDAVLLPTPGPPAAMSKTGRRAWTSRSAATPFGALRLFATDAAGHAVECRAAPCDGGFTGLWWDAGGRDLVFLRFEGWHGDEMALYRWRPGAGAPRRILTGHSVLDGCIPAAQRLLCLRENSTTPRQLVSINPATGAFAVLFDPNPEFGAITLGKVERLHWRNANGLEGWGDLVLPPAYRSGETLPMVVVQYRSQGFLRGGTGDEYPIHALAAHGFAVLSVERVADYADSLPNVRTVDEANAADLKGWAEMKNQVSSIIAGIAQVRARGIVDPSRIGISGLSAGAMSAKFALLNTDLFAAASISGNSLEPRTIMTYTGTAFADTWRSYGFPPASGSDPDLWRPFSLAQNAATMNVPILFQVADDEYLLALEAYAALREHKQPVDLFVFPGEHHEKWQPAHRLAIYQRNVDWFDFWLLDHRDPSPAKAAQYQRWDALRRSRRRPVTPRGS